MSGNVQHKLNNRLCNPVNQYMYSYFNKKSKIKVNEYNILTFYYNINNTCRVFSPKICASQNIYLQSDLK